MAARVKVQMALSEAYAVSSSNPLAVSRRSVKHSCDMAGRTGTNYTFLVGVLAYLSYIEFLAMRGKALVLLLAWLLAGGHYTLYLCYHTLGQH